MSRILIGLATAWLFAGGFASVKSSACGSDGVPNGDCKPCKRPDGTINQAPSVTGLLLDKTELRLKSPPPGQPLADTDAPKDMIVNVTTNAVDAENDVLDYHYTVSAGRIIGSGSNVTWDLTGVGPGTYMITAKVDDSCGICGKTITKGVMIIGKTPLAPAIVPAVATPPARTQDRATAAAPVAVPAASTRTRTVPPAVASNTGLVCACPKISISDPEKSGTDLIFTTKIDGMFSNQLSFLWTIIGGKVVSQDKNSIRINTGPLALGGSISVVVNGLEPRCNCPNQARKTF